jgi:hypothetical protein
MNANALAITGFFLLGLIILLILNLSEPSSFLLLGFIFLIMGLSSIKYRIDKRDFINRSSNLQNRSFKQKRLPIQ